MIRNRIYYRLKPILPRGVRMFVRRKVAASLRDKVGGVWPVYPGSENPPASWTGWPHGHKFAVVLTHDVEGKTGLGRCRDLMTLEQRLGFHSSFNFIPEGTYRVPLQLREELVANGFEVGIHDLRHDGHLFDSTAGFSRQAAQINEYLKDWGACGFRSGFMLRNLEWLHRLNIRYDASTFDTDPFEPQPDGRHTIFPFWIDCPPSESRPGRAGGYSELPYTLPQDSTMFLVLQERTIDIWKKKADWIAAHGGMILLNTHPDYMTVDASRPGRYEFPVSHYEAFLDYLRTAYAGQYWQPLPGEVATFVEQRRFENAGSYSLTQPAHVAE